MTNVAKNNNDVKPQVGGDDKKVQKRLMTIVLMLAIYYVLALMPTIEGLTPEGQKAIGLMIIAVIAWVSEVVPIGIASIFFVLIQHVAGVMPAGPATANFAPPTLLFVLASFFLAFALNMSGLSNRIALKLTSLSGGSPKKAVFYIMSATALLSTVISDVPAAAAFFPIGLSLLQQNNVKVGQSNFGKSLMIGIPFASLIGGVATPAGSSLNVLSLNLLESTTGIVITFTQWAALGIPFVIIMTPLAILALNWVFPPEIEHLVGIENIEEDYKALGPLNKGEIKFIVIFIGLLIVWFTESIHGVPIPVSSTIGAALFFCPGIDILDWKSTKDKIGWDTILLIGASSSLGASLWQSGGATWIAEVVLGGISEASTFIVILALVVFTIVIHLLVPVNPAIVSIMVPTLAALATSMGLNPAFLVVPMGFTVSAAFLLPLDPVPLITYQADYYKMTDYFKGGMVASVIWTVIMTALILLLAGPIGLF